jgi:hypothetical protein
MVPSPSQQKTFDLFLLAEMIAALMPPSERLTENIRLSVAVGTMYFLPFIIILYHKILIIARKKLFFLKKKVGMVFVFRIAQALEYQGFAPGWPP